MRVSESVYACEWECVCVWVRVCVRVCGRDREWVSERNEVVGVYTPLNEARSSLPMSSCSSWHSPPDPAFIWIDTRQNCRGRSRCWQRTMLLLLLRLKLALLGAKKRETRRLPTIWWKKWKLGWKTIFLLKRGDSEKKAVRLWYQQLLKKYHLLTAIES